MNLNFMEFEFEKLQSFQASIDKALFADLNPEFRQQHFLVGLVLSELATVLDMP